MTSEEGEPVFLHVYDLSQGLAQQLSEAILGQRLEGIWHTGVVAYGKEYWFGGGIQTGRPGQTQYGAPVKTIPLGRTEVPRELLEEFLNEIKDRYSVYTYNLMRHNCNHFSNELSTFLTGSGIPSDIVELPQRVLNTPFGAMLAPMIEQMETGMRGNQVPSQTLFSAPPLEFSAVRAPGQANPLQTPGTPGPVTGTPSLAQTPGLTRPANPLSPSAVGTPATPHLANLSQNHQTPAAPAKPAPSPASAQELRASSTADGTVSTLGAQSGVPPTGPRVAAAALAEALAKLASADDSKGQTSEQTSNGRASETSNSMKSVNASREVVQKEVRAEFSEVMKEGKLTANQAAAIALARVLERYNLESPVKKGTAV
jgi:hypothetical protein